MAIEAQTLSVGGMSVDLVRKSIKNLHLVVYPPDGRVRVAAPWHVSDDAIRLAFATWVAWINRQRRRFLAQDRQSKREYVSGETHYFLGRGYRLQLNHGCGSFRITVAGSSRIEPHTPIASDRDAREQATASLCRAPCGHRNGFLTGPSLPRWILATHSKIPVFGKLGGKRENFSFRGGTPLLATN